MKQPALPLLPEHAERFLENYLREQVNKPLLLILTDNSSSMLSVREKQNDISVRLHRIFLNADKRVLDEVVSFVKKKSGKTPAIREFICKYQDCLKARKSRRVPLNPSGKFYNLVEIFNALNREYFNSRISARITWGKRSPRYTVKNRTLGSYRKETNTIRINPVLDSNRVRRYVIEFIVYHEMLHAAIDTALQNGRMRIHSKEFKQRERIYKHYHKAIAWEKNKFRT